jgi:DNA-binding transcriptional regulator YdaS (Cro superfamily)
MRLFALVVNTNDQTDVVKPFNEFELFYGQIRHFFNVPSKIKLLAIDMCISFGYIQHMNLETYLNQPGMSGVAFAKLLGVSQPTVSDWVRGKDNGGKVIPEDRCRQIERATGGAVTCEEMRPDLIPEFAYMRHRPAPDSLKAA